MEKKNQLSVLAANEKQMYEKPTFEVIDLSMESNLLTSSNTTNIKPIKRNN